MTQDQYHEAMQAHPGETPVVRPKPDTNDDFHGWTADDLATVIADAVGSAQDVDGICWKLVGQLVIEALLGVEA